MNSLVSAIGEGLHLLGPSALLPPLLIARRVAELRFPDLLADERHFCRTVGDELAEEMARA